MRTKLRAPLMLEQVEQMMTTDPVRGQEFWTEFTQYWTGYVTALHDTGMITDAGKARLLNHIQTVACDWDNETGLPTEDEPVDPSRLMQELVKNYPELATPQVEQSTSPIIIPDEPKPKEAYSWQKKNARR